MSHEKLFAYVGDHIAAARNSLDLLSYLRDHAVDPEVRLAAVGFFAEVEADRQVLEFLAKELRSGISGTGAAARWRAPRRSRLSLSTKGDGPLQQLAALECIGLALLGRVALWDVLIAMTAKDPSLPRLDYRGLRTRAKEQHGMIESCRLRTAVHTLPTAMA